MSSNYSSLLTELDRLENANDGKRSRTRNNVVSAAPDCEPCTGQERPLFEKILRLTQSIGLDQYRRLLLVLKAMWEDHVIRRHDAAGEVKGKDVRLFLPDGPVHTVEDDDFMTFKPDVSLLSSMCGSPSAPPDDRIDVLVEEMLLNRTYMHPLDSETVRVFIDKKEDERLLLGEADQAVQKEFWFAKCVWIELNENIAELLIVHESARLRNAYVVREFFRLFGEAYIRMKEQLYRVLDFERRIMLKDNNPEWSGSEIEQRVREIESGEAEELKKLEVDSRTAAVLDEVMPGATIDDDALRDYRTKVKKRLREIFLLLHPHRLAHHPSYSSLTPEQRAHLDRLWGRVMEIRQIELKYPEGTLGRSLHSLEKLDDVLDTAKKIMDHSGLDLNVDYIIRGETIAERTAWLNAEIGQLERDAEDLREELLALETNEDIAEKRAIVGAVERHGDVRDQMLEKAAALEREAAVLALKYRGLFPDSQAVE